MNVKMSLKDRITKAHITMMRNRDWVWLAPTCMVGKVHITQSIPTAATDGLHALYNPEFMASCSEPQLRSTVVHENMHKALRHMIIYQYLVMRHGPKVVNAAMDFCINRYIVWNKQQHVKENKQLYLDTWDGLIKYLYDPKYDNEMVWDTPTILKDLLNGGGGGGGRGKGPGQGGGVPSDKWEDGDAVDGHQWAEAEARNEKEQKEIEKELEQALRQGRHLSRKLKGGTNRSVEDLLAPAVNWREAIRDYFITRAKGTDFATWSRPNRRHLARGEYLPSKYTEVVERVGFLIDTSGSIGPDDLREVMSELQGCVDVALPRYVDIVYWGSEVVGHEQYEGLEVHNLIVNTKPVDGGGTRPSCVVEYFAGKNVKFDIVIWLSDGFVGGDWGEGLNAPAFWVINSNGDVPSHLPHVKLPRR